MSLDTSYGSLNAMTSLSQNSWLERNWAEKSALTLGAAAIDMGVQIVNSVANIATFGGFEDIQTRSVLQDLGADGAVAAYDNNTDAVELLSFVGGVFIPGAAAVKLSRGIRAGLKGTNFLSPMRHKEDLLRFESLVKNAQSNSVEFATLKRNMYLRGQAENLMDNVAAELAILGTFNAHPYLEYYLEDPASNFAISMAIGGGIGGAVGVAMNRIEMNKVVSGVETAALGKVQEAANMFNLSASDNVAAAVSLNQGINNLKKLASTADPEVDQFTKDLAKAQATKFEGMLSDVVNKTLSPELLKLRDTDPDAYKTVVDKVMSTNFLGAEVVSPFRVNSKKLPQEKGLIAKASEAIFGVKKDEAVEFRSQTVFNPELGSFVSKEDADRLASAAELSSPAEIAKAARSVPLSKSSTSFDNLDLTARAGDFEVEYLKHIEYYNSLDSDTLLRVDVIQGDLPAMSGWANAVKRKAGELRGRIATADPEADAKNISGWLNELTKLENAKLRINSSNPYQLIDITQVKDLPVNGTDPNQLVKGSYFNDIDNEFKTGGIKPLVSSNWGAGKDQFQKAASVANRFYDYMAGAVNKELNGFYTVDQLFKEVSANTQLKLAKEFVNTPFFKNAAEGMIEDGALSDTAKLLLMRWIGGNSTDKEIFRTAMASARTLRAGVPSHTLYHEELTEILKHPRTLQSKAALAKHANKNGDIFIYRGLETKVQGDTTVSSYTFHPRIADNFGTANLFKINKDDVLTYLYDREQEWLVGAATRDYADASGVKKASEGINIIRKQFGGQYSDAELAANPFLKPGAVKPDVNFNTVDEVLEYVEWQSLGKYVDEINAGVPREIAAMKYNINPELKDFVLTKTLQQAIFDASRSGDMQVPVNRWTTPEHIKEATSFTRRQLTLTAKRSKHTEQVGAILDKQRQHLRNIAAMKTIQDFEGPMISRQAEMSKSGVAAMRTTAGDVPRAKSDVEIAAELQAKGFTGYTAGKEKFEFTVADKNALEFTTETAAGQRILSKQNIVDSMMYQVHEEYMQSTILASGSVLARKLYAEMYDKAQVKLVREGLKVVNNATFGNPFTQSADFATSLMGNVGKAITEIGDLRQRISNYIWQKLATPIATELKKLQTDDIARTEFAYFDNIRQSSGEFMRFDPAQATFVKAPEGAQWDRATKKFYTITQDAAGRKMKVEVKGQPVTEYVVKSQSVASSLSRLQDAGDELYEMQATLNRLKGINKPSDLGFWMPSVNYVNKSRRYVLDTETHRISMLVGANDREADELVADFIKDPRFQITAPRDLDVQLQAETGEAMEMVTRADMERRKRGIGLAVPDIDPQRINDIMLGIQNRINAQATSFTELSMYDVVNKLDAMAFANQPKDPKNAQGFMKAVQQLSNKNAARDMKSYLTGHTQVGSQELMSYINKTASTAIHYATVATTKAWQMVAPNVDLRRGGKVDYVAYEQALKAQGIPNPMQVFQEAARSRIYENYKRSVGNISPDRIVNASNNIAATMALKFGELAQPLVNMLSWPILTTSTISRTLKAQESPAGMMRNGPLSIMMGGIRRMNSDNPINKRLFKMAEDSGLLDPQLSELDELMRQANFATGGAIGKLEEVLDSKFVTMMSKPSEWAERLVRKAAFSTGIETALRTYGPDLSDKQIITFARDFMKQSLGNYTTSQRPMMFQGTAGAAMGLFQTYMLTYAQNMYRHMEIGDYKGLGKVMLAQGGIFGAGSLPGFQAISQTIGEHFSEDNVDLTTGLYRALPDEVADIIIYGLPSTIAPAVHTRGDVNPRIPTGFTTLVAPSMIAQLTQSMLDVTSSIISTDKPAGQAFFEALSTQSVSRPIARMSELVSGYSVTGSGNQIAGPEEIYSWQGALARVFSTRPLREAKAREAIHLNTVYGSMDSEDRKAVLENLKIHIRNESLSNEVLDDLAYEYLRTGSPQGFRQAVNQAMMEAGNDGIVDLHSKLGDSPLMYMLDDIE